MHTKGVWGVGGGIFVKYTGSIIKTPLEVTGCKDLDMCYDQKGC